MTTHRPMTHRLVEPDSRTTYIRPDFLFQEVFAMKRWGIVVVLFVGVAWLLINRFTGDGDAPADQTAAPEPRTVDVADVIECAEGVFVHAPKAIAFVRANPTSIPGKIPGALDEAGLLVRNDGKAVKQHFSIKGMTPWGPRGHLPIR